MNIPEEGKPLFHVLGWLFIFAAFAVIFFPYWVVLFGGILCSGIMAVVLGIWSALKNKLIPKARRVCFFLLALGYTAGTAIVLSRLLVTIQSQGWLGRFR